MTEPGTTVVASANVLCTLGADAARESLRAVLDQRPDLVGLQEWTASRRRLLGETGPVRTVWPGRRVRGGSIDGAGYLWLAPAAGGCPVGLLAERFALVEGWTRVLGGVGRSDRAARPVPLLPPRVATVVVARDRLLDRTVALVDYHLTPGVQARGRYRDDRPLLVARHREEVRRLGRLVEELLAAGHATYAVGDSNLHGLRLPGLTSAWEGREDGPGTFGHRQIDDVHGPSRAVEVTLLETPSDHRALLVRRADLG